MSLGREKIEALSVSDIRLSLWVMVLRATGAENRRMAPRPQDFSRSVTSETPNQGPDEQQPQFSNPSFPQAPLFSRLFFSRQILLFGEITMDKAQATTAQLLALAAESQKPIELYLHSPGGHVESADTIFDVIRFIDAPVTMIGSGWVASAGALIFVAVPKERRLCLPNTRFLLHQPLGGVGGPATDVEIEARQITLLRARLNQIFAEATGQPVDRILKDTERNYWLSATEAQDYGLVGRITVDRTALGPS
jgi:ATP-dependent Clp protease protease subunit